MALTAEVIAGFAGSLLAKKYDGRSETPACHREWWEMVCSKDPLVAIAAPRGHAKSTTISFAYLLAAMLFRERSFALLVSDTETQAAMFLSDIKAELRENEDLVHLFQIKEFIKDTETDVIVSFEDGVQFRILVRGAEQRVRGLKWGSKRPDLIVCDDLEGDEQVLNKERREKLRKWFEGALLPSRSREGIVRVVGTVLHMDSLLNRLLPEDSNPNTIRTPLKSYDKRTRGYTWKSVRYRAHDESFDNILWANRYDAAYFQTIRQRLVDQGIPEVYSQEYLNYPIDESTAFFKRQDFSEIPDFLIKEFKDKKRNLNYYAAVDFAVSTADRSDYTVIAIAGVDDNGKMYVLDVRRGRWDSLQIIEEMFAVQRKYDPELFAVERGTIEKSLGPILKNEMMSRNCYLKLHPLTPTKDKQSRARGIQARIRSSGVLFDKGAPWYADLEDEMVRFPRSRHDDQVDALAWLGLVVNEVSYALSTEEEEDLEYEEFQRINGDDGKSPITGY
jgi:predicted phage terminase large subunit-like protein